MAQAMDTSVSYFFDPLAPQRSKACNASRAALKTGAQKRRTKNSGATS
jgi:hypothetical protein